MRIGITCHHTFGGSGTVATELGMELARRGHEVHFITFEKPYRLQFDPNIYFHQVPVMHYPLFENTPASLSLAVKMHEVVCNDKLDILHVHYAIPHATAAYLVRQMCTRVRVPYVTTLHGTDITLVGNDPSYHTITKFSIEQSNAVTCVSQWLKDESIARFDIQRSIQVIHNPVDIDRFQRREPTCCGRERYAPNGEPILIHISNFRPVKRIDDIIHIFHGVRKQMPAKLLMVGDGPLRNPAQQLARDLGIDEDVTFLGTQDHVETLLSIADLCLLPSEYESFGLAALEANACEVPVIASHAGGLPEAVGHGETGYLCPMGDIESMTARALEILRDPVLHDRMGKAGAERARRLFAADQITAQYERLYEGLLNGDPGL